jgi:peptide-methionine (S)-S-oxide reductase
LKKTAVLAVLLAAPLLAQAPAPKAEVAAGKRVAKATFAGGCFWCMEPPFEKLDGVLSVTAGYTGGTVEKPTYEQVSAGGTGHAESVQILYDTSRIPYENLLDVFWHNIDPTDRTGQFCDHGSQYRPAIFVHDEEQRRLAEVSMAALDRIKPFPGPVVVEIVPATTFWPAEEYHQHYHSKNPIRYAYYRRGCGRDARLKELWGAPK